jgi:hypothetical protein
MSTVRITPNKKSGDLVNAFKKNPELGFIQLESSDLAIGAGWIKESKRTALLKAKCTLLNAFIKANPSLEVPGKIGILEFTEDNVPEVIQKEYLRDDLSYEEAIESFIKRAGEDGPALTFQGKRILKFQKYDPSGEIKDIHIQHDNISEVMTHNALRKAKEGPQFPGK